MARRILAVMTALLALGACSHPRQLVGKWRSAEDAGAMVWEFADNGSVIQGTTRGRYTLGDNQRIKIETPFAKSVYQMELTGDTLTLTDSRGSKLKFTRIKADAR